MYLCQKLKELVLLWRKVCGISEDFWHNWYIVLGTVDLLYIIWIRICGNGCVNYVLKQGEKTKE